MYANYPKTTTDKQTEYSILVESKVNWTLIRLPLIEQTDEIGEVQISLEDCLGDRISATDLVNFLVDQLTDETYIKKSSFLSNV